MADGHHNTHRPTDQIGEVSTNIQLARKEQLADLKQLWETNPALSNTQAAPLEPYEDAFPDHPPSDTFSGEPLGLNNAINNILDPRRKQGRSFDPLPCLGHDMMYEVLLYVVNLWDIAEAIAWGTENIPRNSISDPFVLMNVNRLWSQFIPSYPRLWSHLLLDTDDEDVLEYLKLSLQLSHNRQLFIVLHGSMAVCDGIMAELLRVGGRIGALVYPPSVSRPTLAEFGSHLGVLHDQAQHICQWYELEVQPAMRQYMNRYPFPTSIQSLWVDGLFLPSHLVTLPYFQSLSSLSMRISLDGDLPPAHHELELPTLERLVVQMALASHRQVDTPIFMICRNLKLLDLRYTLELDLKNLPEGPVTPMEFGVVDALQELQINLTIHEVNKVGLIDPLVEEWLQGLRRQRLEREHQRLKQQEREQGRKRWEQEQQHLELEQRRLDREEQRSLEREEQLEQLEQQLKLEQLDLEQLEQELVLEEREREQQRGRRWGQWEQHLRFVTFIQQRMRQGLDPTTTSSLVRAGQCPLVG